MNDWYTELTTTFAPMTWMLIVALAVVVIFIVGLAVTIQVADSRQYIRSLENQVKRLRAEQNHQSPAHL